MPGQASGRGQTQEISHFYKRADSFISWRLMPAKTQSVKKPLFYQIGELLLWNLVIPQDTQLGYCDREYYPSGAITLTKAGARVLFHDVARRSEAGAASARSGENILSDGIAGKTYASYQPVLTTAAGPEAVGPSVPDRVEYPRAKTAHRVAILGSVTEQFEIVAVATVQVLAVRIAHERWIAREMRQVIGNQPRNPHRCGKAPPGI